MRCNNDCGPSAKIQIDLDTETTRTRTFEAETEMEHAVVEEQNNTETNYLWNKIVNWRANIQKRDAHRLI